MTRANTYTSPSGKRKCRACRNNASESWLARDPERQDRKRLRARDTELQRKYGITLADYERMLAEQEGRCGICCTEQCVTGRRFAVDHDHATGYVRGLLCYRCNAYVAWLEADATKSDRALAWIERGRI